MLYHQKNPARVLGCRRLLHKRRLDNFKVQAWGGGDEEGGRGRWGVGGGGYPALAGCPNLTLRPRNSRCPKSLQWLGTILPAALGKGYLGAVVVRTVRTDLSLR